MVAKWDWIDCWVRATDHGKVRYGWSGLVCVGVGVGVSVGVFGYGYMGIWVWVWVGMIMGGR